MPLGIQPNNSDTVLGPTIRKQQGALNPLKPTLQQGGGYGIKTSLCHVDLTNSQHQPGLNRNIETTSLQLIQPHMDRCIKQNFAQLFQQSITAVELFCDQ